MSNLQKYTLVYVSADNKLLTEEGKVSVKRTTKAQIVETVAKGFAGVSPGSLMCNITVSNAIPSSDFELDPGPFMKSLQVIEIGLQLAGKVGVSRGFIIDDSIEHGTDSPSGLSFDFVGTFPDFQ